MVSYDRSLAGIFQNLLGATAIFDNLDHANQAARATRFQVRMVTLDGSEIRPGGSFAGGANRNNNSLFIKPELDALSAEIKLLSADLQVEEEKVAQGKQALEKGLADLEVIKSEGEAARLAEQKVRLQTEQLEERLADLEQLYELQASQVAAD